MCHPEIDLREMLVYFKGKKLRVDSENHHSQKKQKHLMTSLTSLTSDDEDRTAFRTSWGDDLSPSLTALARLCDAEDWSTLRATCETQIKISIKKFKAKKSTSTTTTSTATASPLLPEELTMARAFLARAHLGLHAFEEAQSSVQDLRADRLSLSISSTAATSSSSLDLHDYRVLRLVCKVLLTLHQPVEVTSLYAAAYTHHKGTIASLGDELFLAYGRTCDFMSQQKLAMKMYREFKDPKYVLFLFSQ